MSIPRLPPDSVASDVASALHEHGCAIVEELAPPDLVDRVRDELASHIEATPLGSDDFSGCNTRRTGSLLARSEAAREMIAHPLVLDATNETLWSEKTTFQLHLTQAISIGPGSPAQQLHRDHWCFDFFPFNPDLDVELATIWALDDFTEENGATRVIPDSHRTTGLEYTPDDTVAAEMAAGSVVLYVGGCVHGGGANRSDRWRTGINVDYALGWLRQEENQYLSVPIDVARGLPEPIQRLMGYQLGAYALGYVDGARDPIGVLRDQPDDAPTFAARP